MTARPHDQYRSPGPVSQVRGGSRFWGRRDSTAGRRGTAPPALECADPGGLPRTGRGRNLDCPDGEVFRQGGIDPGEGRAAVRARFEDQRRAAAASRPALEGNSGTLIHRRHRPWHGVRCHLRSGTVKAIKIKRDGSVKLPRQILRRLPQQSEMAVWAEGDTIILKRVAPASLTRIAERQPARGPALNEIAAEVNRMRREKRRLRD